MVNNYGEDTLNLRSAYLFESINESFKEHNIPYNIIDDNDKSKIWNIYDAYDCRTYNNDVRFPVTEDSYIDGFYFYVILEYIENPSLFAHKKIWFILRGHNYFPGRPYLENYKGNILWDSIDYSYEDIIKIINILDRQTSEDYQREYDEYMANREEYDSMYSDYDEY